MNEATETYVFPILTNDQKLAIREAQFQLVTIKEQATAAVKQAEGNLFNLIQNLSKELDVPKGSNFDISTLTFSRNVPAV